jgi:hypothetical protein
MLKNDAGSHGGSGWRKTESLPSIREIKFGDSATVMGLVALGLGGQGGSNCDVARCTGSVQGDPNGGGWDNLQSELARAAEDIHEAFWKGLANVSATSPDRVSHLSALSEVCLLHSSLRNLVCGYSHVFAEVFTCIKRAFSCDKSTFTWRTECRS